MTLQQSDLNHFIGDLERFQHPMFPGIIYTPGVQYLAEHGEAYWLIDAVASHIIGNPKFADAIRKDYYLETVHFWHLAVDKSNNTATLTARKDDGIPPFITQEIEYTDFPLSEANIWASRSSGQIYGGLPKWVLFLPSEY